ncbi:hypothetical protein QTP88_015070 [Uroleucon formosanum]
MNIPDFGIAEVKTKIKNLRSTYSQELKKIECSKKSGAGTDYLYIPQVKWFKEMEAFLQGTGNNRKTHDNLSFVNHFQNSVVFRGTSKTIQNELLDCILTVARNTILMEINNSDFIAIIVDETTDIANTFQLALVFRYEINGKPVERFWGYSNPDGHNAESLTETILKGINPILEKTPSKLIAQSYDGAAVISGQNSGVNVRVREKYPFANFIHCYEHQLNLIMTQATSQNKQIKIFFSYLSEIPVFFSNSPQRVAVLDDLVGNRLPRAVQARWNFNIRMVNKVYEHKESLIECMEKIISISLQNSTINQATGLKISLDKKRYQQSGTTKSRGTSHVYFGEKIMFLRLMRAEENGKYENMFLVRKIRIYSRHVLLCQL